MQVKTYYLLTKPGILMGNLITTLSGLFLASRGHFDPLLFSLTLLGLGPIIASACIFNNYIDREADRKMSRTKHRPLASGLISPARAITLAVVLGIFGLYVLSYTNLLATLLAFIGFLVYVVLYSYCKYYTTQATLIGSIAGAIPPVVGYCAISNHFDLAASLLFLILVVWQMPHFFAIALYRFKDYSAAAIPTLAHKKGPHLAKVHMLAYVIAFALLTPLLPHTGTLYLLSSLLLSAAWLYLAIRGLKTDDDIAWAKQMFRLSLIIITLLCLFISIDPIR
jgi:protoheme IX farnesyltransferase